MIIIVGGEPELCWVSERVGSVHAHIHYACASLWCARVVRYIEKNNSLCGVSGKAYVKKDGDTDKEAEASRSASVSRALLCLCRSLSLSSLALHCAGVSPAFRLPIIDGSCHCSPRTSAWQRWHMQLINIT